MPYDSDNVHNTSDSILGLLNSSIPGPLGLGQWDEGKKGLQEPNQCQFGATGASRGTWPLQCTGLAIKLEYLSFFGTIKYQHLPFVFDETNDVEEGKEVNQRGDNSPINGFSLPLRVFSNHFPRKEELENGTWGYRRLLGTRLEDKPR